MKKLLVMLMVVGLAAAIGCGEKKDDKKGGDDKKGDDKKTSQVDTNFQLVSLDVPNMT